MENSKDQILNDENVKKYFGNISSSVYDNSKILESLEDWVISEDSCDYFWESLNVWANNLVQLNGSPKIIFEQQDYQSLAIVLAYIPVSKALKILSLASKVQPGIVGDLAKFCKEEEDYSAEQKLFIKRLRFVIQIECYNRIFNVERRKEILRLLKNKEN